METWVVKYWLPLLLILLATAIYYDHLAIEQIDVENERRNTERPPLASTPTFQATSRGEGAETKNTLIVGQHFNSLKELEMHQQAAGFVRTGYFGKHWPAKVSEVLTDRHKLIFVRQNGTRHTYNKFDGYQMKMVRLKSGPDETIVVFRSRAKLLLE
jgi:hypothetical protein